MRIDPTTGIRHLTMAAVLCLALGPAGAQQQGQQGGFAPSPNQQPQSPQQPEPEPPPGAQPVPFEAELEQSLPSDRRIATAGGLIWDCTDDHCRAEGSPPQGRTQTVRLCGDLARRVGEIARMTVGNAVLPAPTLERCNQAARFAGNAPEPETPGGQEGGFVPTPDGGEPPAGAETVEGHAALLTVEGEAVRAELAQPRSGPVTEAFLPEFSYHLNPDIFELSEDTTLRGGVLEISDAPFEGDCETTIDAEHAVAGDPDATYYEGISVSGEKLDMLLGRVAYEPHYVRVCPVVYDSSAGVGVRTMPATNTVEVVFGHGPDVEIVSVDKLGPPGRDGLEALYGHAYNLEMTLRNNDDGRVAEVLPAYSLNLDAGPFHAARFGVGAGAGGGAVSLDPGETKTVRVMVDLRPGSISDTPKQQILSQGSLLVSFFLAHPEAPSAGGLAWYYEDANIGNHSGVLVELDVRRRFEVEVRIPWVKMHGTCEVLRFDPDTRVYTKLEHEGEQSWKSYERVNFNRGPLGQEKPVDYRFVLSDAEPGWEIDVSILLARAGSGRSAAAIGYATSWSDWRYGVEAEPRNDDSRDCPLGSIGAKVDIETRMLPIE